MASKMVQIKSKNETNKVATLKSSRNLSGHVAHSEPFQLTTFDLYSSKKIQPIDAWTTMGANLMKQRCSTSSSNSRKHSPSPTTKVDSLMCPHLELHLDNQIEAVLEDDSYAMQVMVKEVINVEEQVAQIAQLTEAVKKLQKTIEEKDVEISSLMEKLEVHHDNDSKNNLHGDKKDMSGGSSFEQKGETNSIQASLLVEQLQDMIGKTIKAQ
ncbi:hypothetical protein ACLB2K_016849 [Fragaria x ananassa]